MGAGAMSLPPPPPGFVLHDAPVNPGFTTDPNTGTVNSVDIVATSPPPPPPGFVLHGEATTAAPELPPDPTQGESFASNAMAGLGASIVNTGRGIKQLFGGYTPEEIDEQRRMDALLMHTGGGIVGNVVGQGLQMAVPVGEAAKAASLLGKAAPYVSGALRAGTFGATQGVGTGETRAGNAGEQAAYGAAGTAIAKGLGAAASKAKAAIAPEFAELVQKARGFKIPLHLSQLTDSKMAKTVSSALNYLPLSGGSSAIRAQQEAFNRAVGSTFDAPAKNFSDTVVANVRKNFNNTYNTIFHGKEIPVDVQAVSGLQAIRQAAARDLESEPSKIVQKQVMRVIDNTTNGTLTGKLYQSLRGELKKFDDGTMKGAMIMKVRDVLDEAAARALGPKEAARLAATNAKYANFKTAEAALKQVAGAKGNVSPASLWNLIKNGSTQEMRDLAKIGQVLLKDPIPDSGTAARTAVYATLGASGAVNPVAIPALIKGAAIGATAGRLANSSAVANALTQGKPINALARLARPAPVLLPAIASAREKQRRP